MTKKTQRAYHFPLVTLFIVVLTCITAWIMFASKPEIFNLKSDDGLLSISGTSNNAKSLYIASHQTSPDLTVYTVSPESLAKQADMKLTYTGRDQLFVMDDLREAWRPIESTLQSKGHAIFAQGKKQEVKLPDYTAWMDEALATPADHAIGYEQFLTYQVEDALPVYFAEGSVRQQSCKQVFFDLKHMEEKQDVKEVRLPVDGVNRKLQLTLVTRWFINRVSDTCAFVTQK